MKLNPTNNYLISCHPDEGRICLGLKMRFPASFRLRSATSLNEKLILKLFFLFLSALVFGQNLEIRQGIKANFSQKSIQVYQENSQNKLDEFYEYLTLFSTEKDVELKNQIRENIFSMVENEFKMPDFTQSDAAEISLEEFLSKIENQSFQFKVKSRQNPGELGMNHWMNSYVLSVSRNGKTSEFDVEQIIYFEPKEKQFGSKTKTVWEVKLGDIQQ